MTDEIIPATDATSDAGTPAIGDTTGSGATPGSTATSPRTLEEALLRLAEREKILTDTRKESIAHRKKLDVFEREEAARRDAQLSDHERLQQQMTDLQSQHTEYMRTTQERIVRYEIERMAQKLRVVDPDAAVKLLDWAELEFGEDGTPTNAEKLLKELLKRRPYLESPAEPLPPPPSGAPHLPAMNPGRTSIQSPPAPRREGPIPRLADYWSDRNKT